MTRKLYTYLDAGIGPIVDKFIPYPVLIMSYTCKKCGRVSEDKSFRQFLFELCDHKGKE